MIDEVGNSMIDDHYLTKIEETKEQAFDIIENENYGKKMKKVKEDKNFQLK